MLVRCPEEGNVWNDLSKLSTVRVKKATWTSGCAAAVTAALVLSVPTALYTYSSTYCHVLIYQHLVYTMASAFLRLYCRGISVLAALTAVLSVFLRLLLPWCQCVPWRQCSCGSYCRGVSMYHGVSVPAALTAVLSVCRSEPEA